MNDLFLLFTTQEISWPMTSKLNNLDFIFSYYERKNKRSECDITPVEMSTECLEIFKHDSFSKILFNFL